MTFDTIESSVERGEPAELYLFRYGDSPDQYYAYTDAERAITHNGIVYSPTAIKRSAIVLTGTQDRAALTINVLGTIEVAELFRIHSPSSVVWVEIFQGHVSDADGQFLLCWSGRVLNCRWKNRESTLTCEPISTALKRPGLRRNYQFSCPYVVYDQLSCRASKSAASLGATVTDVVGTLVTLSVASTSLHAGGMLEWTRVDGRYENRTIVATPAGKFQLAGLPAGLTVGLGVVAVRGCDHTLTGCQSHLNVVNFGGQPWIPMKNPMSTVSPFR